MQIAGRIRQRPLGNVIPAGARDALIEGARICLAEVIAGPGLPQGTHLLKVYATIRQEPR